MLARLHREFAGAFERDVAAFKHHARLSGLQHDLLLREDVNAVVGCGEGDGLVGQQFEFAGVRLQPVPDGTLVSAPHLPEPRMLADLVEVEADGCFVLRGRQADMIEIAGKRASLADLTRRLLAIDGVRDKLRVLLVSGEPHAGERTWRNLLKSDPRDRKSVV